jgi:hypothetical protein
VGDFLAVEAYGRRMTNRQIIVTGVIGALAIAAPASAENKSWTALKNKLPAEVIGVVSVDIKAIRGAASYKDILNGVLGTRDFRELKQGLEIIKAVCSVDAIGSISDFSLAITPNERDMVAAVGLDGIDEEKIVDCVGKIASQDTPGAKVSSRPSGVGKAYTLSAGKMSETLHAAWPSKDVFIISGRPDKATSLDGYAAGKAAAGDLATFVGKASAGTSIAWIAGVDSKGKDGLKGGYGTLTLAKGSVTASGRLVALDAAAQKKAYLRLSTSFQGWNGGRASVV